MKKPTHLVKLLSLLVVSSLLYYSCQQDNTTEFFEEETYQEKIETYEKRIANLEEQLAEQRPRIERPKNIIGFRKAQRLFKNYNKRAEMISSTVSTATDGTSFAPTRSLFYEISELRKYLKYIEHLSKEAGVEPTGIRLYFGLYPENHVTEYGNNSYAKRQTLFIAPTLETKIDDQIVQVGYTLANNHKVVLIDSNSGFAHSRVNQETNQSNTNFYRGVQDINYSLIANEFQSSPPIGNGH